MSGNFAVSVVGRTRAAAKFVVEMMKDCYFYAFGKKYEWETTKSADWLAVNNWLGNCARNYLGSYYENLATESCCAWETWTDLIKALNLVMLN